ncbi:MAG: tetratricopeptide repeat protein [Acidobacteriota bacterium]
MLWWTVTFSLLTLANNLEPGRSLRREGRLEEAVRFFEEALAAQPDSALALEARRDLGHCLALAGRYREAMESYQKLGAVADPRWQLESFKWAGLTHLYRGEFDEALAANAREQETARRVGDPAAQVHAAWYRGHVRAELGQFAEANAAFITALEVDPDEPQTLHLAGLMTARQGDTGSLRYQIDDLRQALRGSHRPSQIRRVHHLDGELALLQEQPARALALFEKANGLFPHPLYREAMARAWLARGDLAAAEAAYRNIVQATDERLDVPLYYVKALHQLARVLEGRGERQEAAFYYQRFLDHWEGATRPPPGVAEARRRLERIRRSP